MLTALKLFKNEYEVYARGEGPASADYRASPRVRVEWDEATCTQLVFLYNALTTTITPSAPPASTNRSSLRCRYQE